MAISDYSLFYLTIQHMNDEQIYSYFHSIYMYNVLTIIAIATGSLALREYLAFLGAEYRTWKLLFQGRIMPARLAIIVVRYAYIGAFISAVYFMTGKPKPKECQPLLRLVFGLYTVLWSASGSIFLMRLNIIFSRQRKVMILFYFLWSSCICLWGFITSKMNAYPIPKSLQFPFGPTCATERMPKISAIAWAGSILFDSIVFIATFIRFRNVNNKSKQQRQQDDKNDGNPINTKKIIHLRSKIWIFRSSLYYFAASFFFNSAMLISSLTVNDPMMSNCGNALAFAIHSIVATRLVFNTKGWSQNDSLDENGDEIMLNTFNKNRRNENGILSNNIHPTASRITYTVDETVVTSFIERENSNTPQEIDDQIDELRINSRNRHRKSFRKSRDQIGIAEVESNEDEENTIQSGKCCRIRGNPYEHHHHSNTLPKVSTSRKGSIQQKITTTRESIESLETKYSSKDDFAIRRKQEQIIPIPPNLYRPENFTQNRRQSLLKGGKSKALLDIAIKNPYLSSSRGINEDSRASSSSSTSIINNKKNLQISTSSIPSPPGTLSSPPSYSVLDRLAKSEEGEEEEDDEIAPCTFSNKSPSLPSSYEIQQYQEYLLNVSKDENGESSSNSK